MADGEEHSQINAACDRLREGMPYILHGKVLK
jgi:hypothetical protein